MHDLEPNTLLTMELAYKHNPDVLQLIEEIRELRLRVSEAEDPPELRLRVSEAFCCATCGDDLADALEVYCGGCSGHDA